MVANKQTDTTLNDFRAYSEAPKPQTQEVKNMGFILLVRNDNFGQTASPKKTLHQRDSGFLGLNWTISSLIRIKTDKLWSSSQILVLGGEIVWGGKICFFLRPKYIWTSTDP